MKRRVAIGFFVSVAALGLLYTFAELPDFGEVLRRIRPAMLAPFVLSTVVAALLLALRWKQLTGPALGFRPALSASLVGSGGNMVLPLRGGEFLKVLRTSGNGSIPIASSAGSLVMEKALDLAVTAIIAVLAVGMLLSGGHSRMAPEALFAAGATLMLLVLGFVMVRRRSGFLERCSERLLIRVGGESLHRSPILPLLARLSGSLSLSRLLGLLGLTVALHVIVYAFIYMYVGWLIGVELGYAEALFVLIAAAFGMTVPAAPSGVGVYHAAVVSAFYAMGRPVSEGVALGVTVHALIFAAFVIPAGVVCVLEVMELARRRGAAQERP